MAYIFAAINWSTFWSSLLAAVPGLFVSLLVLRATRGINQSLEKFKSDLQQDTIKFTKWHEKRLDATAAIYNDFEAYLDFLRLALYFGSRPMSMDPAHAFHRDLQRRMVFLDEEFSQKVKQYQSELLAFWNQSMSALHQNGEAARPEIQRQLDYVIPRYLPLLRRDINEALDPHYKPLTLQPGNYPSPLSPQAAAIE
jgi:hypothetical protein